MEPSSIFMCAFFIYTERIRADNKWLRLPLPFALSCIVPHPLGDAQSSVGSAENWRRKNCDIFISRFRVPDPGKRGTSSTTSEPESEKWPLTSHTHTRSMKIHFGCALTVESIKKIIWISNALCRHTHNTTNILYFTYWTFILNKMTRAIWRAKAERRRQKGETDWWI